MHNHRDGGEKKVMLLIVSTRREYEQQKREDPRKHCEPMMRGGRVTDTMRGNAWVRGESELWVRVIRDILA